MKLFQEASYIAAAIRQPVILFHGVVIPLNKAKEYLNEAEKYPMILPNGDVIPKEDDYSEFYR